MPESVGVFDLAPRPSEIVAERLRHDCPYNARQRPRDLLGALRAELDELEVAVDHGAGWEIEEELGDVAFALASLAAALGEEHALSLQRADRKAAEKMISRHPYVFDGERDPGPKAATEAWEAHKAEEAKRRVAARRAIIAAGTMTLPQGALQIGTAQRAAAVICNAVAPRRTRVPILWAREAIDGRAAVVCMIPGTNTLAVVAVGGPRTEPERVRATVLDHFAADLRLSMREVSR